MLFSLFFVIIILMTYFSLQSIALLLVGIIDLILGALIYLKERENKSNVLFALVTFSVSGWVLTRGLFEIVPINGLSRIVLDLLYISASLIPLFFVLFTYTFPFEKIPFSKKQILFIAIPNLIIIWFVLIPGFVIGEVNQYSYNYKIINFGFGYLFYSIYILGYFLWGFINLIKKYLKSAGILKIQLVYIFCGTFIATLLGVITNLILPFFGSFRFFWLGPVLTIVMVLFIAYAIIKHHLLNIKIIATEIFASSIVIVVLVELFLSKSTEELTFRIIVLLLVGFFAYLLVQGALKEVKTREQIEKLAGELEKANARLQELGQAKSEFVTIASHQLRAPITAIKGYASMLMENSFGTVPKEAKVAVERILQSSDRLVRLITDFLNLSRIERGKMEYDFQKFDLKNVTESIFDDFSQINKKRKVPLKFTLEIDENEKFIMTADQEKARQAMSNIVDNALKYTKEGFVKISLYKNPKENTIIFKVQDSGTGMDKDTLARIFQKFTRAHNGNLSIYMDGIGLGLYVAKEIMKAHDGDVWAESEGMGKGSSFFIEFPQKNIERFGKGI